MSWLRKDKVYQAIAIQVLSETVTLPVWNRNRRGILCSGDTEHAKREESDPHRPGLYLMR